MMSRRASAAIGIVAVVLALVGAAGWWLPQAAIPGGQAQVVERVGIDTSDNSSIYNGGDLQFYTDDHSTSSILLDGAGAVKIAAPTAIATATPAAVVDSLGVSNIFEVRDASTPVVQVSAAGKVTVSRLLQHECTYVEEAANTNENLTPASSCYVVAVSTSVNADYTLQTTGMVTGTLLHIVQIGAGTLVITDTNVLTSDGNAVSHGANDASVWMFDGSKWQELLKLAGS
jgi:hypothetical protein